MSYCRKILMAISLAVGLAAGSGALAQNSSMSGTLYTNGTEGYDFGYPPNFRAPSPDDLKAAGANYVVQSRFKLQGTGFVTSTEHALVAFTQISNYSFTNSPNHLFDGMYNQKLFSYGVGAFVGSRGLTLEMWTGNRTSVIVNQDNNKCMTHVPTEVVDNSFCLTNTIGNYYPGFLQSSPGFQFDRAKYYWVVVQVTNPTGGSAALLNAKLYEQPVGGGPVLVQEAGAAFTVDYFLPHYGGSRATVGRTPNTNPGVVGNIAFDAFDH